MRTRPASLISDTQPQSRPQAKKAEPAVAAEPTRWYRVKDGPKTLTGNNPGQIGPFRRENGDFFLKLGNVINSTQYDMEELKNAGVELLEVEAPGWYVKAQRDAAGKVEELRDAGIDVGDAPDYVPTPVGKADPLGAAS